MNRFAAFCAAIALVLAAARTQAADLCQDPRVSPAKVGKCQSYTLPFWDGKSETQVSIAKVPQKQVLDYDVVQVIYEQFLQLPNGEIVNLGPFPQEHGFQAQMFLLNKLGISPAYAGGAAFMKYNRFYDSRLENIGGLYCIAYHMKAPFRGTYSDCGSDRSVVSDDFGYVPGVTSWRDAVHQACAQVNADTGRKCANNDIDVIFNDIAWDDGGAMFYAVGLRRRLTPLRSGPGPVDYDYFIYRVEPMGGAATLVKQTAKSPNPHDWMNQNPQRDPSP